VSQWEVIVTTGKRFYRLIALLEAHSPDPDFLNYLPSPDYIQKIIILTNAGLIEEALSAIERTEHIFNLLSNELDLEESEWFSTIIHQLRLGVTTARN